MTRGNKAVLLAALVSVVLWLVGAKSDDMKIGVVDVQQALVATDEGKAAREELVRKQRDAEQQIKPLAERFKGLTEELEGKRYVLSDEALFAKRADLLELKNKIDNKYKELEGQLKIDESRLVAPLQARVMEIIEEVGKKEGFTLILARNTPGVIYSREALDITDMVIKRINKKRSGPVPRIHPSAIVDPGAKLADDVEVGPCCCVGPEVELAGGVVLRPHALVTGRTRIGPNTRIFPFAVVGEEPQDKSFSGEATKLVIGADNVIREHTAIHVGTAKGGGLTQIGDNNLIMNGVHVGHDSQIGSHTIIASHCALGGHVVVEDYGIIGGLSGIHQFARIGESAMVAAKSGITKDAPPFSLVSGERARVSGINVIGIRRRGFSEQAQADIKHAFHILFNSKLRLEPALERVRAELSSSPEVQRLLHFLETSTRGVSR